MLKCVDLNIKLCLQREDPCQENQCAYRAHQALEEQRQLPAAREGQREEEDRG